MTRDFEMQGVRFQHFLLLNLYPPSIEKVTRGCISILEERSERIDRLFANPKAPKIPVFWYDVEESRRLGYADETWNFNKVPIKANTQFLEGPDEPGMDRMVVVTVPKWVTQSWRVSNWPGYCEAVAKAVIHELAHALKEIKSEGRAEEIVDGVWGET